METHRPFTMQNSEYRRAKAEKLAGFLAVRRGPQVLPKIDSTTFVLTDSYGNNTRPINTSENNLLSVLSAYGIHLSSAKDILRLHKDEYETEMDVVAHVLAYFDISSKRLVDDVPRYYETVFAKSFGNEMETSLTSQLNLVGDGALANCARFVKDEPEIQARRNELERKEDILTKAVKTVNHFFK